MSDAPSKRLLDGIDGPADLRGLDDDQLQQVAQEVREQIIDTIGEIGGHFGANLGACELAVAIHSLLDSPRDKVLWDVGHQAYPHKVLTGRRDQLQTIRKYGGLAPFCAIHESEHDIMGAGHASTAIGYAVGLKEAMRHGDAEDAKVVAVVGDGAMTGGVAFEAVHQAGGLGTPIVVILNDNGMSIAPNVGALSRYMNRVRLDPGLWEAREGVEEKLTKLPAGIGAAFERLGPRFKESVKAFWAPGLWWEELDWAYLGVIDGHDVRAMRRALRAAFEAERPVVIHCREATDDCLAILARYPTVPALFHCFTGSVDEARNILAAGHLLGFTGPVTYKKSEELRDIAKTIPHERLLVETDAPYLAPKRWRGKRNEPSYVVNTAEVLAETIGLSYADVARITTENAFRLFSKMPRI